MPGLIVIEVWLGDQNLSNQNSVIPEHRLIQSLKNSQEMTAFCAFLQFELTVHFTYTKFDLSNKATDRIT